MSSTQRRHSQSNKHALENSARTYAAVDRRFVGEVYAENHDESFYDAHHDSAQNSQMNTDAEPPNQETRSHTPSERGRTTPSPASQANERIGERLRRARNSRGEGIDDVADYLCIRPAYIEAIEKGHYNKLPADAYVIGFLRSYAIYLGFDGKQALDAWRQEMSGKRVKLALNMPQPVVESRGPSMLVFIAAAFLLIAVYVIWYNLTSHDKPAIEPVPVAPATSTVEPITTNDSQTQVQGQTTNGVANGNAITSESTVTSPANAPSATNVAPPSVTIPPAGQPSPANQQPVTQPTINPATSAASVSSAAQSNQQANIAAGTVSGGMTLAQPAPAPSVVIKANRTSWVLVADSRGVTVFDRVMQPGDTWQVPDNKAQGLYLTTGNGGGITLLVSGNAMAPLGTEGRVVRNVSLDPDALLREQGATQNTVR